MGQSPCDGTGFGLSGRLVDYDAYVAAALRTEHKDYSGAVGRLSEPGTARLLHAVLTIVTEAGELADAIKKHVFYGKPLDHTHLVEEAGDLHWGMGLLKECLRVPVNHIFVRNIKKLAARYGGTWTKDRALNRDLERERKALEGNDAAE